MAKPTSVPRWANSPTTLRTEPSETTKDAGFAVLAKLPAQYFNWLLGLICDWLVWITSYVSFDAAVVSVTGSVKASDGVEASNYMNPSNANDTRIVADTVGLRVTDAFGVLRPVARKVDMASAMIVGTVNISDESETEILFTTEEYDTNSMYTAGQGRMVATVTGYYHIDLYVEFVKGATTMLLHYIALKHSADARVLAKTEAYRGFESADDGHHLCVSMDCYLTAAQYVYAVAYQDNESSDANIAVLGRLSMHRID